MTEPLELLELLANRIVRGKVHREFPHPPELAGQDGASELCAAALAAGIDPEEILRGALIRGMKTIGVEYEAGRAFVPELILSGKAMYAAMDHLKPLFARRGADRGRTVILGTVAGDVHDIGKNVVRMVLTGEGFDVIDLGVDVTVEVFLETLAAHPGATVAMSALLTTTMPAMAAGITRIHDRFPGTEVYIGGAPVTAEFSEQVRADGYFPDPHSFARYLGAAR